MLDGASVSSTVPILEVDAAEATVSHEASVGRIGENEMRYLASRGLDETSARRLLVGGFLEPIVSRLPLEYAVELEKLIDLEMAGAVG